MAISKARPAVAHKQTKEHFRPKVTASEAAKLPAAKQDLSVRKKAEQAVKESEARRSAVLESSLDAIVTFDEKGRILDFNSAAKKILGCSVGSVMGQQWSELIVPSSLRPDFHFGLSDHAPGSLSKTVARPPRGDSKSWKGGKSGIEATILKRQAGGTNGVYRGVQQRAAKVDSNLLGKRLEITAQRADGLQFPAELTICPVRQQGRNAYAVWIRDITERRDLENQLWRSQKMEAVGRLAGGVAHDFNNLLTVITGYSDLLLTSLPEDSSLHKNVVEIKKAGGRAASLTRQLLAFSRRQVLAPRVLDLNAVVANVHEMLRRLIGEDIALVNVLDPTLWSVKADPGQIEQVLVNLTLNARDAMPDGGKLTIETANLTLTEVNSRRYRPPMPPGQYVMLAVSDNGHGMDQETESHVFEPFFTTKAEGRGTGLGLATVYGIVKQSGGYIWVYSEPQQGATFKVYLPRARQVLVQPHPVAARIRPAGGTETVLLVEDEVAVRELVHNILASAGYTVLAAAWGGEALRIARLHPGRINLLLTDVVMPQMSGPELAEQVERLRPEIRIVYMSGYTEKAIVHHGILDPHAVLIQKPFTPDDLARKIRQILDSPKRALPNFRD